MGETQKTVSVPVLGDDHDEGRETFTLTLTNVRGNAYLADATGEGAIVNDDPMPLAWIARFGRTVAEQMIEAMEQRIQAPRTPGASLQLAGMAPWHGPGAGRGRGRGWRTRPHRGHRTEPGGLGPWRIR